MDNLLLISFWREGEKQKGGVIMKFFNFFIGCCFAVVSVWFVYDLCHIGPTDDFQIMEARKINGMDVYQKIHTVKKGDSFFSLALKHGVHVSDIKRANRIPLTKDILTLGQKLWIPKANLDSQEGIASWYGPGFHGKKMANGQTYNQNDLLTVAHSDWPLGTKVLVINLETRKTAIAIVRDRGSFREKYGRLIDCSVALAKKLDFYKQGTARVRVVPL